eukprot:g3198.t1
MAALSSPMKNNNDTFNEVDDKTKDRLFTSKRARGSFTLDDNEVKTGEIGEKLRSEKEILLQFDSEYFDPKCDAIKKALEIMTKKIPTRPTSKRSNPFTINNSNDSKVTSGNPFGSNDNSATTTASAEKNCASLSEGNPFASTTAATIAAKDAKNTSNESNEDKITPSVVWGKEDIAYTKQSIREITDNVLMDSISEHDRIKDAINRRLMTEVVSNYSKFIRGLQHVNEVDMDLTRASLFVKTARKQLLHAKETIVHNNLTLATKLRRRQRMQQLHEAVKLIQQLSNLENDITNAVENDEFVHAENMLRNASLTLKGDMASEFTSLNNVRNRLDRIRPWLRRQIDEFLQNCVIPKTNGSNQANDSDKMNKGQEQKYTDNNNNNDNENNICNSTTTDSDNTSASSSSIRFSPNNYRKIIKAYRIADLHTDDLNAMDLNNIDIRDDNDEYQLSYMFASKYRMKGPLYSKKGITGMAERIQTHFLNAIESIIRNEVDEALPGPSITRNRLVSISSRSSFSTSNNKGNATDGSRNNSPIPQTSDDEAYVDACKRLTTNQFINILKRVLLKLTDLLHSHFLCTQWHRDPFSPLNKDPKYLHRSNRESDESTVLETSSTAECSKALLEKSDLLKENENDEKEDSKSVGGEEKYEGGEIDEDDSNNEELVHLANSIGKGLLLSRKIVWDCVVDRLNFFVSSVPIKCPNYHIYHAAEVVTLLKGMDKIGADFLQDRSCQYFENVILKFSKKYLKSVQKDAFNTLSDFLNRENWESLHVSLRELGGMESLILRHAKDGHLNSKWEEISYIENAFVCDNESATNCFEQYIVKGNPFQILYREIKGIPQLLKQDTPLKKKSSENNSNAINNEDDDDEANKLKAESRVMTSTTVNGYSKFAGLYYQIMGVFPHASETAIHGLFHLVDYYMHAVINIFLPNEILENILRGTPPNDDMNGPCWRYTNLRNTAIRIDSKINNEMKIVNKFKATTSASQSQAARFVRSSSLECDMNNEASLYGLEKSCIATESLFFLNEINEFLLPRLENEILQNEEMKMLFRTCHQQSRVAIEEFRSLMYDVSARRVLPRKDILAVIARYKWDKKDLPETYYPYVTTMLETVGKASGKMQSMISKHLHGKVWVSLVDVLMEHLLEALSRVKKCSNNGRAQMALDLATLYRGLEQIAVESTQSKRRNILSSFIKAYYFDKAEDLLIWMEAGLSEGGEFSEDHVLAKRHFLSLISLEKSPISKLSRSKRNDLKKRIEEVWMKAILEKTMKNESVVA